MYVLGIDGGGTKTSGVVADENGKVYIESLAGPSNPNTLTHQEFEAVLKDLLSDLEKKDSYIFSQLAVCFAGMSGAGDSGRCDKEFVEVLSKHLPPQTEIIVRNDSYNALYAETLGKPGIVQIAGTGSITFGLNDENKTVRSGGWGYLFDEAGSAFHLGNEALRAVFKKYDGRGPATVLTDKVLKHFNVAEVTELVDKVHGPTHPRSVIAQLAPLVIAAAEDGDEASMAIIWKACENIMDCIESCHKKLFDSDHPTLVILSGGVFNNSQLLLECLIELSKETLPNIVFRESNIAPVAGAVVGGLKSMGFDKINEKITDHINIQLNESQIQSDRNGMK